MVDFGLVEYGQNVNKVGYSLAQVSILTYQSLTKITRELILNVFGNKENLDLPKTILNSIFLKILFY